MDTRQKVAVVAGVGPGLGEALCRKLAGTGFAVAGIARSDDFAGHLADELRAAGGLMSAFRCDTTDVGSVEDCFRAIEDAFAAPAVLIYNAGAFLMKPFAETTPEEFERMWAVNCRGAFLCARRVVPGMLNRKQGTILFTGATASVKPGASFSAFGSSKYALRGMAQSMARELGTCGIHVAHVVIDGVIWTPRTSGIPGITEASTLSPNAIADTYVHLIQQDRSAWTLELDVRPDVEPF
jgi:NAD(P)-dependent dehydrogenase (short-subunit alcohol dehydrogenase family)